MENIVLLALVFRGNAFCWVIALCNQSFRSFLELVDNSCRVDINRDVWYRISREGSIAETNECEMQAILFHGKGI
jgi:hypothetical protein